MAIDLAPVVKSITGFTFVFALAKAWLYFLTSLCAVDGFELTVPKTLNELKTVSVELKEYKNEKPVQVLVLFCSAYLYKQTFAMPGSVMLNVLGGALYGTQTGLPLVCFLRALGSTFCFCLSKAFIRYLILNYFPLVLLKMNDNVECYKYNFLYLFLGLRFLPYLPGWLIDIVSPHTGISTLHHFFTVLVGTLPFNYVCVETGAILAYLGSLKELFTDSTLLMLFIIAGAAVTSLVYSQTKGYFAKIYANV